MVDQVKSHTPRLVQSHDVHKLVHGDHSPGRFNTWLAVVITKAVGSMWCAYIFTLIALIGLPQSIQQTVQTGSPLPIIQWIAQTFLQLVLLSVIMVGQNVLQSASDARAFADHQTLTAVHTLTEAVKTINEQQTVILNKLAAESPGGA